MQELITTYQTKGVKDVKVKFTKTEGVTSGMKQFIILDNEKYKISLFPVSVKPDNNKRSYIKYNAQVYFKSSCIAFNMAIRELVEDGSLIAGQQGKMSFQRAVVTEWDPTRNVSYERLAIPENEYREIMAMVAEATTH